MRPVLWLIVPLLAACNHTPDAPPTESAAITHYETSGNLQARPTLDCLQPDALNNSLTAADLYLSNANCVKADDLDAAIYSSALAGVYARYDSLRVADQSAHQAQTVLSLQLANALTEAQQKQFMERLMAVADNPARLATLCARIRDIGPPDYHPTYMIQHGMGAFSHHTADGLVTDFDSDVAWEKSLTDFLHCPAI